MKKVKTFSEALKVLRGDVEALKYAITNAVIDAMGIYAEATTKDTRALLSKPHWLLSRKTGAKVIEYEKTDKIVTVVGFERTTTGRNVKKGVPDPGIYARYYQGGQRRDVPAHFLRTAKARNVMAIPGNIVANFSRNVKRLATGQSLNAADVEKR